MSTDLYTLEEQPPMNTDQAEAALRYLTAADALDVADMLGLVHRG